MIWNFLSRHLDATQSELRPRERRERVRNLLAQQIFRAQVRVRQQSAGQALKRTHRRAASVRAARAVDVWHARSLHAADATPVTNLVRLQSSEEDVEVEPADVVTDDDVGIELMQFREKKVEQTEFVHLRREDDGTGALGDDVRVVLLSGDVLPSLREFQTVELANDGEVS